MGLGLHVAGVHSLVTEPCLSIMGSFVAREKVADMTCSSQLSSGGERGRPLKRTMSLYTQTTYVHIAAMYGCACKSRYTLQFRHIHTYTCVKDVAGDQGW